MDNDDLPVGRILSRREVLALFGATGAAILVGCGAAPAGSTSQASAASQASATGATSTGAQASVAASASAQPSASLNPEAETAVATATAEPELNETAEANASAGDLPSCVVSPEQTEGPYYADVQLDRSDIRSDPASGEVKDGVPLALTMRVSAVSAGSCTPLEGAVVEIWHCDAAGVYSAFEDEGTANQQFLRGNQTTGADGSVQFTTIYPGWYRGRAVHIHFKVNTAGAAGENYEFTSQMYFDDALSDQVYTLAPYNQRGGQRDTLNADDGIYGNGGDQLTLALAPHGSGYAGTLHIGLDLSS